MKLQLFLTLILIHSLTFAHFKPNPQIYFVQYQAGEKYNKNLSFEKQSKIGDHIKHTKDLYHKGKVILGGVYTDDKFGAYYIQAKSQDSLTKILKQDPAVQAKIIKFEIRPYTLTMFKKNLEHNKHRH